MGDTSKANNKNFCPKLYKQLDIKNYSKEELRLQFHNYFPKSENSIIIELFFIQLVS